MSIGKVRCRTCGHIWGPWSQYNNECSRCGEEGSGPSTARAGVSCAALVGACSHMEAARDELAHAHQALKTMPEMKATAEEVAAVVCDLSNSVAMLKRALAPTGSLSNEREAQ